MFITFEGLDFSGKSTQVNLLEKYLEEKGQTVVLIREPGGTKISEKIRDILLDKNNSEMDFHTELLLFSASRAQLVNEVIIPSLKANYFVISDRFHDSSIAYQGYGRGIDLDFVIQLQKFVIGEAVPDLTFFIDLPVEEVANRMSKIRSVELDRIETSKLEFYRQVRAGYLSLAEKEKRFRIIDGTKSIEMIQSEVRNEIKKIIDRENNVSQK